MAILTYHHIGTCPPEQQTHQGLFVSEELFQGQLQWLHSHGYRSITLSALVNSLVGGPPLPKKWVLITFDDGWRDNFLCALPLLQNIGFTATIFLITEQIDACPPTGRWDDYLTLSDIRQMQKAGIEFGSHTHTHPRLTHLSSNAALAELTESRRRLQQDFQLPADWFCYPYGNFSQRIAGLVKQAGYRAALSTIRDNRVTQQQLFWMPRVMIMNDTQPARLKYLLSPWYHLLHTWKNRRRWKPKK